MIKSEYASHVYLESEKPEKIKIYEEEKDTFSFAAPERSALKPNKNINQNDFIKLNVNQRKGKTQKSAKEVTMAGGPISSGALRRSSVLGISIFLVFTVILLVVLMMTDGSTRGISGKGNRTDYHAVEGGRRPRQNIRHERKRACDKYHNLPRAYFAVILSKQNELPDDTDINYFHMVAEGLSKILGVDYNDVRKQAQNYTKYLDRTIKKKG